MLKMILKKKYIILFIANFLACMDLTAQATEKPNVIFIIFDDMNDYTETLGGQPQIKTPGINELESLGTTFLNAYTTSPKCAPSRTSFLTGKDLAYTQIYKNPSCKPFRDFFSPVLDNEEVYTIPEYMKDFGGYYTYGINKTFHCFDSEFDFDSATADPCSKSLSWNKYSIFNGGEDEFIIDIGSDESDGAKGIAWANLSDTLESFIYDYRAIDSASLFMRGFSDGSLNTCDKPFFMILGMRKPHLAWFVPQKYFFDDYVDDYYAEPFNYPYNNPVNTFPPNGVVMPPQPDTIYNDYLHLGELGKYFATYDSSIYSFQDELNHIDPLPEIDPLLSDDARESIMESTIEANGVMAYIAAIQFLDAQVARLIDSLSAFPEIYSNTIIIAASDHGFSLGEKMHWQKGAMWETDLRVPLIIADLRNPQQQSVITSVSLLDLFPTICDLTETPHPVFTDGTSYLDGKSLLPLLENPAMVIEKPSLSSYEEHEDDQCSCFPQYSIRNNRFHYILYTSNNAAGVLTCNEDFNYQEAELYEIGMNRDVDPNEWNNLITDVDYQPIVNYLEQWLPDSSLYLQKTFTATIQTNELDCFANEADTLQLSFLLSDTTGTFIIPPSGFDYLWTTNLSDDSLYGTAVLFPLSLIDAITFSENKRLMVFLQMKNQLTGVIEAIDLKYIYLNETNTPSATFNVGNAGTMSVCITDYSITGSYTKTWWDFGDGHISNEHVPGPYTYATEGSYLISHYVQYGNDDCIITFTELVTVNSTSQPDKLAVSIFPNPANTILNITIQQPINFATVRIYDLLGRQVKSLLFEGNGCSFCGQMDVTDLNPGAYIFTFFNEEGTFETPFIIAH